MKTMFLSDQILKEITNQQFLNEEH